MTQQQQHMAGFMKTFISPRNSEQISAELARFCGKPIYDETF